MRKNWIVKGLQFHVNPSMRRLPEKFLERLQRIIPPDDINEVLNTFSRKRQYCVRVNSLNREFAVEHESSSRIHVRKNSRFNPGTHEKTPNTFFQPDPRADFANAKSGLKKTGAEKAWKEPVFFVPEEALNDASFNDRISRGTFYIQGLSSQIVPLILDPRPGERILDLCAAPGSKASQIADITGNGARIVCVEAVKKRVYKLKSVFNLLGVDNADIKLADGRRYGTRGDLFDRVLVDAPCSSEGRFNLNNKKTHAYWSPRKIKEMRRKQKGLLLNAVRNLRLGGVLVYSTCTFAPEENEAVIDWALKKTRGDLTAAPVDINLINHIPDKVLKYIKTYPAVRSWGGKTFSKEVGKCLRILPNEWAEGFFICKLVKETSVTP